VTGGEFAQLLNDFTLSAESGDGARFAGHFTEDAIYYDYIYGAHNGRADIAHMMHGKASAAVYGEIEFNKRLTARLRPAGYAGHASPAARWLRHA